MAAKTEKIFNSFVKGLITEASPLTYPENASLDEENFVLNRDGSRYRRLGLDYEDLHDLIPTSLGVTGFSGGRQSFHRWDAQGKNRSSVIGVVRLGNRLYFLDLLTPNPSGNLLNGGTYETLAGLGSARIETANISNKLVIVSKDLAKPIVLTYDPDADEVSQEEIDIKVRDIWGLDDGLDDDTRPTTLSNTHKYNLRNQGWSTKIVTKSGKEAIQDTRDSIGGYPSNSDQWTLGKISNAADGAYEKYDPTVLQKNSTSRYQVSRGSIILNAFTRGASREANTDVTGLNVDKENGYLSTVASYAQRIFYSGVDSNVSGSDDRSPNYNSYVFFSKVVTTPSDLGDCYQEADPTDPGINDLIASDGGTIQIPEATRIVKIASAQASLLVFAENGVWEIYGDTGGFIATSFQASKISKNGVVNPDSVVNVNGNFVYWSNAGIYTITPDTASGRFAAQSISLTSIQQLFLDMPELAKRNCKGFYDEKENRVRWIFNDSPQYSSTFYLNAYNKELVYDLTLQAWSKNTFGGFGGPGPHICDYVEIPGYAVGTSEEFVYRGTDDIEVTSGDLVVVDSDVLLNRSSQFSYLTIINDSFTLSKYISTSFKDWVTQTGTGVDYTSYLVTGYELFNDVMRVKQTPYIFFYFLRTEDGYTFDGSVLELANRSSCLVQAQWNWANSNNSGKWGSQFQAYRLLRNYIPTGSADPFDYGDAVIVTKNKLRGSGKTLSLKIESETGKDMKLLGWAVPVTATTTV